jgi:predicted ATPase
MLKMNEEALTLARELGHPWSFAFALHYTVLTHQFRRERQAALQQVEELRKFAHEQGFPFWLAMATITRGFELVWQGASDEGMLQMRQGLAAYRALGAEIASTYWLALLAEGYLITEQIEEGLSVLAEIFTIAGKNGERVWESELYRLKGELLLKQREKARGAKSKTKLTLDAERCFQQALERARHQSAKSFELRAVVSLSRLWQKQGKAEDARQLLTEIYDWFTEGFETADLREAKALLTELTSV